MQGKCFKYSEKKNKQKGKKMFEKFYPALV